MTVTVVEGSSWAMLQTVDDGGVGLTRAEHVAWAKARALAWMDRGDPARALPQLVHDFACHDELAGSPLIVEGLRLRIDGKFDNRGDGHAALRAFIEAAE